MIYYVSKLINWSNKCKIFQFEIQVYLGSVLVDAIGSHIAYCKSKSKRLILLQRCHVGSQNKNFLWITLLIQLSIMEHYIFQSDTTLNFAIYSF
jgi:hypothetical protein